MPDQAGRGRKLFAAVAAHHGADWTPSASPKFGANALRVGGRIYVALTRSNRLLLKLAPDRVTDLVAAGSAERFESGGRAMSGWVTLKPDDAKMWIALSDEARAYATAHATESKRTRKKR